MSGLAATLLETEPGIRIRLLLDDGRVIAGVFRGIDGDTVDLDGDQIELTGVERIRLEFNPAPAARVSRKAA